MCSVASRVGMVRIEELPSFVVWISASKMSAWGPRSQWTYLVLVVVPFVFVRMIQPAEYVEFLDPSVYRMVSSVWR